ncbi:MAG: flagellar biosynthesis protein [Oxalobacteraceae bacterium]|jgi:flagellar biosynthesis protein|nr:flagellar biosynthesis protein [Oxalobacteraceae bacterium]NDG05914.1 flagellar biosynthesis protein [Oxalobacteraceae bacterium]
MTKSHIGAGAAGKNQAVALLYESNSVAPRVLAKGEGLLAEAILSKAQLSGIPLRAEPELVGLLMQIELNDYIPPSLYMAVAEVIAWVYQLNGEKKI